MTDSLGGDGSANDAFVLTDDDVASLNLDAGADRAAAEQVVAAAQTKVDRQKEHLAGAEQALATAQAALAALEGA